MNGPAQPVIDVALVRRLIAEQFPKWAHLPLRRVEVSGWDNRTFRLGDELSVRLPSAAHYAPQVDTEHRWLPVLAPRLPLPIPTLVARGAPTASYPYPWSVRRWLSGEPASVAHIDDLSTFAVDLAGFLAALARVDPTGGPRPGPRNFWRGGPLATYAAETLQALDELGQRVPRAPALAAWEQASATTWPYAPVWFHGDVAAGNLLVREGRLAAVIDFGQTGVGDPACDLAIAWTTFPSRASRHAFRAALGVDDRTWARGRGWALWKALIILRGAVREGNAAAASTARRVVDHVLSDHAEEHANAPRP